MSQERSSFWRSGRSAFTLSPTSKNPGEPIGSTGPMNRTHTDTSENTKSFMEATDDVWSLNEDLEQEISPTSQKPSSSGKFFRKSNSKSSLVSLTSPTSQAPSSGSDHLLAVQAAAKLVIQQHTKVNVVVEQPKSKIINKNDDKEVVKDKEKDLVLKKDVAVKSTETVKNESFVNFSRMSSKEKARYDKFEKLLTSTTLDITTVQKSSWSGISSAHRAQTWRLLCGYVPTTLDRRKPALSRKRTEYKSLIGRYFEPRNDPEHSSTFRQIHIDIPRTHPGIEIFQKKQIQELLERLLFIWSIRHPASGYVQGINDLATPFMVVFLLDEVAEGDLSRINTLGQAGSTTEEIEEDIQWNVEADTFWCLTRLLDTIQDHFTFAQPGIVQQVQALEDVVKRVDPQLHEHIVSNDIQYLQFAFRWMNNLLMREIPLHCTIRLWDAYLAEQDGFKSLHLFVCASFLIFWKRLILEQTDFQSILMLLQNLPTTSWTNDEIDLVLAEAFTTKYTYGDAPKHYQSQTSASSLS